MSNIKVKRVITSKQWSVLNKRVFQVIGEKTIAYKHEIELFLELEGYQNWDVGRSLAYLSKTAPYIHLETTITKINGNDTKFFFRKKAKLSEVRQRLSEKKDLLNKYFKIAESSGKWAHDQFFPKLFNKAKFIVLAKNTEYFNEVNVKGDIDLILDQIQPGSSKIFVDIKNSLNPYRNRQLFEFFEKLINFDLKIIPVVVARKIYEDPKKKLKNYGGDFIEVGKVLMPMELRNISKEFNVNIADITRVIPDKLIPRDLSLKANIIQKLKNGFNFSGVDIDSIFN